MNPIVVIGGVVVVVAGLVVNDVRKKRNGDGAKRKVSQSLQEFLPLERFHESGAIVVANKFRKIVRIGDMNLYSMSTEAIRGVRDRFLDMLKRLDHPFQISVQARRANYGDYVKYSEKVIRETALQYNNAQFTSYSESLTAYLKEEALKPRTDRENLFIMGVLPKMGGEEDKQQLERLAREQGFVEGGLRSMGLPYSVLEPVETVEAIQNFWNRERAVSQRYRDAFTYKIHAPLVDGAGVEVEDIAQLKKKA